MRYVALGDSTVEGLEDPDGAGGYLGWADRLARHLEAARRGVLYANLAVRGQTATQVRHTQLEPALALRPDLAVVVAGVNDLLRPTFRPDSVARELEAMHQSLRRVGARVVTFTMPDLARVAPLAVALRGRIVALNAAVREVADGAGSLVVDFAAEPVAGHPALWHDDRLHANSEGHRRIALALAERLGVTDVPDWRSDPPPVAHRTHVRVAFDEARWATGHLLPWAWRHLRGQPPAEVRTCKRPELRPVAAG